jgi:hypothetical protein
MDILQISLGLPLVDELASGHDQTFLLVRFGV